MPDLFKLFGKLILHNLVHFINYFKEFLLGCIHVVVLLTHELIPGLDLFKLINCSYIYITKILHFLLEFINTLLASFLVNFSGEFAYLTCFCVCKLIFIPEPVQTTLLGLLEFCFSKYQAGKLFPKI